MVVNLERTASSALPTHSSPVGASRALVPLAPAMPPAAPASPPATEISNPKTDNPITGNIDFRNASPRQIADISLDLYAAGLMTYEDYTRLAFQAELHPDYNRTVGALTGEPAAPDRPRDFVHEWSERLQFELRHFPSNSAPVKQSGRIHELLKGLGEPTRLSV